MHNNPQRDRLLAAMLAAVNHDGYDGATVANVTARARVSRRTFYDYFTDKDDCFLALYRDISRSLIDQIGQAVRQAPPEQALQATVRALTEHAQSQPGRAYFVASTALGAGFRALDERERVFGQIKAVIQTSHADVAPATSSPDLPAEPVIGAVQGLIAQRLRHGESDFTRLNDELASWLVLYKRRRGVHRWRTLEPGPQLRSSRRLVAPEESEPPSRSDRSRISRSDTARDRRGRILIAAAESAVQHGYAATTVTEIAARARLDKRVFYDHFSDKRQAFLAVHELAFKQTMSIAAAAYLSAKRLPERVWRSLRAASDYHAANPAFAYVGYVESHALGSPAIQRADESRQAFAIFLHAASERIGEPHDLTAAEATGAAIFEIAHRQIRHDKASQLPRYAYHASFICLAPLLGVAAADRFVQAKINDANNESPPGPK